MPAPDDTRESIDSELLLAESLGGVTPELLDGDSVTLPPEMKRRASAALFVVVSWGFVNLVIGFAGNLVLARLLDPRVFGIVAVGSTVMMLTGAFSEGGIGNGLIRRSKAPTAPELRTLTGIQLIVTLLIAVVVAAVALQFGEAGQVTAVMIFAMPISSFQSAGRVVLGREIRIRQITIVDACSVIAYYAWSVGTVAAGFGVWGLATGTLMRAATGTAAMAVVPGGGLYAPSLGLARTFGPLIRFGVRFQANWIAIVARDQTLNAVIGIIGGVVTLGLWSLAGRLMQLPGLLFEAIGRVTFPALSHLLTAGGNPRRFVERTSALAATAAAFVTSALAAGAPGFVPGLFGSQWMEATKIFPGTCAATLIGGSLAAGGVGYLFAADEPGAVLRSTIAAGVCGVTAVACLLPFLGTWAVGIGAVVGAIAEGAVLQHVTRRLCGANIVGPMIVPLAVAVVAGAIGWFVTKSLSLPDFAAGAGGALTAAGITLVGLGLFGRAALRDLFRVALQSISDAVGRDLWRPRRAADA